MTPVGKAGHSLPSPVKRALPFLAGVLCGVLGAAVLVFPDNYGSRFLGSAAQSAMPLTKTHAHMTVSRQVDQQQGNGTGQQRQQHVQPAAIWPGGFRGSYTLPEECRKHAPLYAPLYDYLRPWMARGITQADLDACHKVAPAGWNISLGTSNTDVLNPIFRLLSWDNEILVTSGGLERVGGHGQQPLHYHMLTQIQEAAKRFGLPNVEFAVSFGDYSAFEHPDNRHGPLCPQFMYAKHPSQLSILIPSGDFVQMSYDAWLDKMRQDPDGGVPWEQKDKRAIGRWTMFPNLHNYVDRFGKGSNHLRRDHANHSNATGYKWTHFMLSAGPDVPATQAMPLSKQRKYKYTLNLDGFTASTRFAKLLPMRQTVLKQDSPEIEFFYPALQPWVHYVPTGYNGLEEVDRIVQFLRDHDDLARDIAHNSRRFALTHLTSEGRYCYIKVLFEELNMLMTYKPKLEDFPTRITYQQELDQFLLDKNRLEPYIEP